MNRWFKKISPKKLLLGLVIILLCIFAIFFWEARTSPTYVWRVPKPSVPIEEIADQPDVRLAGPKEEKPAKVLLRSLLAGRWYPADTEMLSKQIEGFFQKADVKPPYVRRLKPINNVIAFILPHAGYQFSGQTAALALKTTDKKYKRIVIIGPSHRVAMEEVLSVPRVTHYETPLGQIPLDVKFIEKLLEYSMFQNVPQTHKYEHSVQIELPLLQYTQKDRIPRGASHCGFKLVPIVAGTCSPKTISKAGAILRNLVDKETLVIASSDFVHYGRNYGYVPFTENIPEQIEELDMGAYKHIARLDSKGFLEYKRRTGATICGYIPIAILLSMLDKPIEAELINYTTSGQLTGDFTNSVSYLSIAFSGTLANYPLTLPQHSSPGLTEEDKQQLLTLARESIVYALQKRRVPQTSDLNFEISDEMRCARAAFVTLKKNSQLRGCIGDIFPKRPLYKSVIVNAINAGFKDKRFYPLTKVECNDITIEISALTAPKPIASPDEIRIGIDGVVLNKDGRSAVFLPQVAPEQGWDVNQMLTRLSRKAGLPEDAWKEGASFLVFQAVVFGEER